MSDPARAEWVISLMCRHAGAAILRPGSMRPALDWIHMESHQLDTLVRPFGEGQSRRGLLVGLSGGLLALVTARLGSQDASAAKKRHTKHKKHKRRTQQSLPPAPPASPPA